MRIRSAQWPNDLAALAVLDTAFTTDRIYRVIHDGLCFTLAEEPVEPPLYKEYGSGLECDERLQELDYAAVAEESGALVGFAAAAYERWNRRVTVQHLYVAAGRRGRGIGRALLDGIDAYARSAGARCLWVETQNVNYPAIQFYQRMGFRLCGLDESLYDPAGPGGNEVALFFVRELT
jgi:GNAT superfamily N-acetyltransferase